MERKGFCRFLCLILCLCLFLTGCGGSSDDPAGEPASAQMEDAGVPASGSPGKKQTGSGKTGGSSGKKADPAKSSEESPAGNRDNKPVALVPEASGETVYEKELAVMDASHVEDGYVMVEYLGKVEKVKLQVETPEGVTYTYTKGKGYEVFPLTGGDGDYKISVWEQRPSKGDYLNVFSQTVTAKIADEFSPYLYPNQFVALF